MKKAKNGNSLSARSVNSTVFVNDQLPPLFDTLEDLVFISDSQGYCLSGNKAFIEFKGISDDVATASLNHLKVLSDNDIAAIIKHGRLRKEYTIKTADGSKKPIEIISTLYLVQKDQPPAIISVGRDMTVCKRKEQEILELSYRDALTGLYNRVYYKKQLKVIDTAANLPLSVIICDIDGLKLINDAFGHSAGDELIKTTAAALRDCAGVHDRIMRIGGDEFVMIMPKTTYQTALGIKENIRNFCKTNELTFENRLLCPTVSTGTSTKISMDTPILDIINDAERSMYREKLNSRRDIHDVFISYISSVIYEKSNESEEHCRNIAAFSTALAKHIDLPESDLKLIELASSLHDVGKIGVDLRILKKPTSLTTEEWEIIKKHPEIGWRITQVVPELYPVADIILNHHERWDGLGYPRGLTMNEIPLLSRIIAIADAYDAMTRDRPYKKAKKKDEAIKDILEKSGTQFDPELAKIFIEDILK